MEEWKDIIGYEGKYQVSNTGKIRSLNYLNTRKTKELKPRKFSTGYLSICLGKEKKNFYIHRLVAIHFIPNPNNLLEVNHKDENKTNNNVENLEWCNHKYNCNYGTRSERIWITRNEKI